MTRVDPHSGHYRPDSHELRRLLKFLVTRGIKVESVQVDMQRVLKVVRDKTKKKIETPMLWPGSHAFSFLQHKKNARKIIADLSAASMLRHLQSDVLGSPRARTKARLRRGQTRDGKRLSFVKRRGNLSLFWRAVCFFRKLLQRWWWLSAAGNGVASSFILFNHRS